MNTSMIARFRPVIAAASEREIREDITLGGKLILSEDGPLQVSYAPFEHVVPTARVVIVGITPGKHQATEALIEARRQILAGADDATALAAAKAHGSFSGAMRTGLVAMLDEVGLHDRLGIPTCARLWDTHSHLAHFTSALRYPVLKGGENYNGTPSMTRTAALRSYLEGCLVEEARALPDAIWISCGSTAAKGLAWVVKQGALDPERVCVGLHPSPSSVERVQYFLGTGRPRAELSVKTDPDIIDAIKRTMIRKVAALAPVGSGAVLSSTTPTPAIAKAAPPPTSKTKVSKATKRERKVPSRLGLDIQAAVAADPRFQEHRPEKLYRCIYRTRRSGTVFAFERVTLDFIRFWIPASPAIEAALTSKGIAVSKISRPNPSASDPTLYGRHSALKAIPELKDEALFPITVTSVGQALVILGALP